MYDNRKKWLPTIATERAIYINHDTARNKCILMSAALNLA